MIIQNADLFQDVTPTTMEEISKIMVEEQYQRNDLVFKVGDPAQNFYVIVDGTVTLSVGDDAQIDYTANRPGEAFGWTGIVDRPTYVATAECAAPCKLLKINKDQLNSILAKDPSSSIGFYKRLAGAVVQRLIDNYGMFLTEGSLKGVTYGTGQVMGTEE